MDRSPSRQHRLVGHHCRDIAVGHDRGDIPPLRAQTSGHHIACPVGLGDEHPAATFGRVGERVDQAFRQEPVGDERSEEHVRLQAGRGTTADHRYRHRSGRGGVTGANESVDSVG